MTSNAAERIYPVELEFDERLETGAGIGIFFMQGQQASDSYCSRSYFYSNIPVQSKHDCDGSVSTRLWKADAKGIRVFTHTYGHKGDSFVPDVCLTDLFLLGNFHQLSASGTKEFFVMDSQNSASDIVGMVIENSIFPHALYLRRESNNSVYAYNQGGFIPTRDEWLQLSQQVLNFYDSLPESEIQAHNQELLDKIEQRRACQPTYYETKFPDDLKPHLKETGWVYLVTAPTKQGYKIGYTSLTLPKRLREIANKVRADVTCHFAIKSSNPFNLESAFHQHFSLKRLDGEWFDLSTEDLAGWLQLGYALKQDLEASLHG